MQWSHRLGVTGSVGPEASYQEGNVCVIERPVIVHCVFVVGTAGAYYTYVLLFTTYCFLSIQLG